MARSKEEAKQELERLQSIMRSMPDQKDAAAQQVAAKIKKIEQEIAGASDVGSKGPNLALWLGVAVALGAIAFAAAYFGGQMMQG
ncbi:MAG: hypothetical protein RIB45_00650 [Marivibrio sp.]|uniref:hypothetical protein n=1 Tax=Marivibrio sp. TaxID=2039719 RepID=UPI0032ED783C